MRSAFKSYFELLWEWDEAHQQKIYRKKFKASNTKLIWYKKQIVGFVVMVENDEMYLDSLFIDPCHQNLGIGSQVMHQVIEKADLDRKTIWLQVFKVNRRAQKFYHGFGFYITSESEFNLIMKRYSCCF